MATPSGVKEVHSGASRCPHVALTSTGRQVRSYRVISERTQVAGRTQVGSVVLAQGRSRVNDRTKRKYVQVHSR